MNVLLFIIVTLAFVLNVFIGLELIRTKAYIDALRFKMVSRDLAISESVDQLITKVNHLIIMSDDKDKKDDLDEVKEIIKSIPNKINDDYLRIAEETWRLHNRITRAEIDKHIVQPEIVGSTPNHKRQELGLDPIESCDEPYVEGLEFVEDEEAFK
jgi:hypothetical protein